MLLMGSFYNNKTCLAILFAILTLVNSNNSYSQEAKECTVIYLALDGFIIESGNKKIAIDALISRRILNKQNVDREIVDLIENAYYPFNNVDIIFVTHKHLDHFEPDLTIQYLENNQHAILICPQEVFDIIKLLGDYYQVEDRIFPIKYEKDKVQSINKKNISVRAFPLPHGAYFVTDPKSGKRVDRHADVENFGYLINLDGVNIFHAGDNTLLSQEEYKKYRLQDENIDIAFVSSLFWSKENITIRKNVLENLINPDNTILMHLQMGDDLSKVPQEMKNVFPGINHFTFPLETKVFTIDRTSQ